jgi:DNA polymerase III epsilon subunit family exonuclease
MEPERPLTDCQLEDATYITFDTETTGLYPVASRLIEIGAVRFNLDGEEISVFEQLIDPGMSIPPDAQAVNHITDDMVSGQPEVDQVLPAFLDFLGDTSNILIAHNAGFDMGFISVDLARMGLPLPRHIVLDTVRLARSLVPGLPSYSLHALMIMLGIEPVQEHRALADARLTKEVFRELLRRNPEIRTLRQLARAASAQPFRPSRRRLVQPPPGYEDLVGAVKGQASVEIVYTGGSRGEEPRSLSAHAFIQAGGYIYLAGRCHIDGQNKMYRLDRIKTYRIL